jgi:predicted alpha/beta-hydrolase family hydrolase
MNLPAPESISIKLNNGSVSGLLQIADDVTHLYVVAHGAGAGMRHPFLDSMARLLAASGIATLRYQFPYMEAKKSRTDSPAVAHTTVRAAVAKAAELLPGIPLLAGGKSFGGRMTSGAHAESPLDEVCGLVFLGFPLHPPGKPGLERAVHLASVRIPMLFLQGTRDDFARLDLITEVCAGLGPHARLELFDGADHSFGVKKGSGRTKVEVQEDMAATIAAWADLGPRGADE